MGEKRTDHSVNKTLSHIKQFPLEYECISIRMAYNYAFAAEEASSSQQPEAQDEFGSVPTLFGDEDANNNTPTLLKRRTSRHPRKSTSASAMAFNFLIQKVHSCNSLPLPLPALIVY